MDKLEEVEKNLKEVKKQFNGSSLAMEMLKELKAQSKRKDIIIIILIGVILAMIIGFFVYEGQFETVETTEQYMEDLENANNSDFTQIIK